VVTDGSFFRIKWPEYEVVHSSLLLGLLSTGTTVPFTLLGQNVNILQHDTLELRVVCVYLHYKCN